MLDRLPPEILLDILLLALPPDIYSTYQDRQNLLLAYSHVCICLRAVAQPLLWKVVRLKRNSKQISRRSRSWRSAFASSKLLALVLLFPTSSMR
jgi:hypothetical protein